MEQDENIKGVSRRDFLKGIGGGAVGAAVVSTGLLGTDQAEAYTKESTGPVRARSLVTLKVNGRPYRLEVEHRHTLVEVLRDQLGFTGTKIGCDRGECGACTVMIDGVAVYGCSVLTASVRGREVVTVEGIKGKDGGLHPVQAAFIAELGPQCGFCTPGQIVSAVALLNENPKPTRDQARHAMSGNLCRCGAYENYLNGVMRAAGRA